MERILSISRLWKTREISQLSASKLDRKNWGTCNTSSLESVQSTIGISSVTIGWLFFRKQHEEFFRYYQIVCTDGVSYNPIPLPMTKLSFPPVSLAGGHKQGGVYKLASIQRQNATRNEQGQWKVMDSLCFDFPRLSDRCRPYYFALLTSRGVLLVTTPFSSKGTSVLHFYELFSL